MPIGRPVCTTWNRMWGTSWVLLAFVLFMSGQAEAGCSNNKLKAHQATASAHFSRLIEVGAIAEPIDQGTPSPERRKPPCSGAFCSGNDTIPAAPSAFPGATSQCDWAVADLHSPFGNPHLDTGLLVVAMRLHPSSLPSAIFHPPRLG
jgi:hypothetical protein